MLQRQSERQYETSFYMILSILEVFVATSSILMVDHSVLATLLLAVDNSPLPTSAFALLNRRRMYHFLSINLVGLGHLVTANDGCLPNKAHPWQPAT